MAAGDNRIQLSRLRSDMDQDFLVLFFESKTRCPLGGDVLNVELDSQRSTAIVAFRQPEGIDKVVLTFSCWLLVKVS